MICPQHDKILEDFCQTDQQCVCNLCKLYEHKNHEIVSSAAAWTEKQSQFRETKNKVQQQIQKKQKDLQKIKDVVESHKRCAQTAVEDCEMMFTELISSIERRRSEVTQLIRDQETAAVSSAEGLLERLKQEIDDLRRRDAELEKLLHTKHHIHLLQSLSSLSVPPGSTDSLSSITVSSLLSFDDVITSVSHLRDKLKHLCTQELEKISERGLVSCGQSLSDRPLQTTSLTQSRPSASFSGFDEKFEPPSGSWTCDTCLIRNMSSDKRCISCLSPRLNIDSDSDSKPAVATSSLLSHFAPSTGSWSCDTCLIINKPEVVKCVCCDAAKPGTQVNSSLISPSLTKASSAASSTTTTSTGTGLPRFGDTFKKPEGSWDCDLCLVHNNTQDVKCVACETPKPGLVSSGQSLADRPLQTTSLTESRPSASISSSKPPAGSWTCDTCLVRNMSSDIRCVSCLSPQLNIDSDSNSKPAVATSSLLSLFVPSTGSWSCDTCSIINKPEVVKCVCCVTAKPGTQVNSSLISPSLTKASSAASSTTTTSTGTGLLRFGDLFTKPEGSWDCDVCLVRNNPQDVKCIACETPKPGAEAVLVTSAPASTPGPLLGLRHKFKTPEGSWECEVCCVINKAEDQKCLVCQSAKPEAKIQFKGDSSCFGVSALCTFIAPKPERDDPPVSSETILNKPTSSAAANTIPVECQPGDPKFEGQDHLTGPPSPSFALGKSVEAKVSSLSVFGQKPTPAPTFGSTAASSAQGIFEGGFGGTSEVWAGSAAPSPPAVSPVPVLFSCGQTPASNILSSEQDSNKDGIAGRKIKTAVRRRK
ncbi:Nuclear pore complex protein [Triplophysa tibetana]|uniref:Nuclear pore complex protein Nup153 n=1 Tax=Triplophysa tibetana TaxID=1572043 RepID=A0A5A9NL93_9TELE|nr:Nuclear pore complex protein [Triplophysa tibetana]